jgi:hypothetical protein
MREITCSAISSRCGAHHAKHAVQAVLDHQLRGRRLQVDVAGAGLERVVKRRVHQPHHRAVVLADGLERQLLQAAALGVAAHRVFQHRVHGAHGLAVPRQIGRHLAAVREPPMHRLRDAFLGPRPQRRVERVAEREHQRAAVVAEQDAAVR